MSALSVGEAMPTRSFGPVTQTDVVRFAGAGGDFNPLHHDPEAATRAGFERPIAHGQFTAALLAGAVSDWVGITALRSIDVRFRAPVPLGTTLAMSARVTEVTDGIATIALEVRKDGDAVAVVGTATALVDTAD
jgi:acyl dehydratase